MLLDMASRTSSEYSQNAAGNAIKDDKEVDDIKSLPLVEIPNGGLLAWLQVAATFMVFLNTW